MTRDPASGEQPQAHNQRKLKSLLEAINLGFIVAPALFSAYAVLSIVISVTPVLIGWLTKTVIDDLGHHLPARSVLPPAIALAGLGLVLALSPHFTAYQRAQLERAITIRLQSRLFSAVNNFVGLSRLESPTFLNRLQLARQSGNRSTNDVVDGSLGLICAGLTTIGFLSSLFAISPLMACFLAAFALPVLFAQLALSRERAGMLLRVSPHVRREIFFDRLLTTPDAAKEVRLFGTGTYLVDLLKREKREADSERRKIDCKQMRVQTILSAASSTIAGGGLIWAIYTASNQSLTLGDVSLFIAAVAGVQTSSVRIATESARVHHATTLFTHYREIVSMPSDMPRPARPISVEQLCVGIELRDVWFRYSDDQPWVLKGVNLFIPAGQSIGLVGVNGAGKSTLVKLLCRFYDPDRGAILWDGVDLRDMLPEDLRRRMGAVFQDFMSYDLSVRENIALGDLRYLHDTGAVKEAAERAGIHDTIMKLPREYETAVTKIFFQGATEDDEAAGVLLSGGQSQKVALARALLRSDCDFLILDEPSSGMDAEAEHLLQEKIRGLRKGKTSLLISHRLGSLRDANRIFVLCDGTVKEEGSHEELISTSGEYARLFSLQASGYQSSRDETNRLAP